MDVTGVCICDMEVAGVFLGVDKDGAGEENAVAQVLAWVEGEDGTGGACVAAGVGDLSL